ncbi:hypothetical protein vseg_008715 [Gypsophila vaccaria]
MLKEMLVCCKVYISESRNKAALEAIERSVKIFKEAKIVNKFVDETYNRVGYTLVSKLPSQASVESCFINDAALAMVTSALKTIDFDAHCGSHPRLGVVDHICFHPLANASLEQTARVARSLASDIGNRLAVPTYLYGAAHEKARTLDSIRRQLGYFKPNTGGNMWAGATTSQFLPLPPDEGPSQADLSKGVIVVGTTKWVGNYNVPVFSTNISAVREIAKRVSERGGGLPSVQAMALVHGDGVIEVACNLLDPSQYGGDKVQGEVERLAQEHGLDAGKGYFTDFSQEEIINMFLNASEH